MVTNRIQSLLDNLCAQGGVKLSDAVKEAEAIGIKAKYAEEAIGLLASEGSIKIKSGVITLVKRP